MTTVTGRSHLQILGGYSVPFEPQSESEARRERITLRSTCPACGSEETLSLDAGEAVAWAHHGKLVQKAFPELSKAQRERLITGYCDPCFHEICRAE